MNERKSARNAALRARSQSERSQQGLRQSAASAGGRYGKSRFGLSKATGELPSGESGPPDRLRPCGLHSVVAALTPHASAAETADGRGAASC